MDEHCTNVFLMPAETIHNHPRTYDRVW